MVELPTFSGPRGVYDQDAREMLIRKVGRNNVLHAAEPYGTAKNTDSRTGRPFDETIDFIADIDWLTTEEKSRILSGNASHLQPDFTRTKRVKSLRAYARYCT